MKKNNPNKIIVHHSADISPEPQFDKVNLYHKKRWSFISEFGYYVGYHYFIEQDGAVMHARADNEEGAHTIGQNTQSIGICLAGNFNIETPTAQQRNALCRLLEQLLESWQIPDNEIYPHRAFAQTNCYGTMLADDWAKLTYEQWKKKGLINSLWLLKGQLEKLYNALLKYLKS